MQIGTNEILISWFDIERAKVAWPWLQRVSDSRAILGALSHCAETPEDRMTLIHLSKELWEKHASCWLEESPFSAHYVFRWQWPLTHTLSPSTVTTTIAPKKDRSPTRTRAIRLE